MQVNISRLYFSSCDQNVSNAHDLCPPFCDEKDFFVHVAILNCDGRSRTLAQCVFCDLNVSM